MTPLPETLDPLALEHPADETLTVHADDGVALSVEIDHARGPRAGDGLPTVVLVHGFAVSSRSWIFQRRALSQAGHRVVLWDQRSHGRSGPADASHSNLDWLGRDLHAVLEATCPTGQFVLIGHSMGGMTLMAYARQHAHRVHDRVIAVAFVATSAGGTQMTNLGFGPVLGRVISRIGPGVLTRLGAQQVLLNGFRRFGRSIEDSVVAHWSFASPVSDELVHFTGDLIFTTPFSTMAHFLPSLDKLDERDSLAAFHGIEALVINGEGDLITPPDHSEGIVHHIPGAEHVVIADAGHMVMLEHPTLVNQQLLMLIDRGLRARHDGVDVAAKPRVRRRITDLALPGRSRARSAAAPRKVRAPRGKAGEEVS